MKKKDEDDQGDHDHFFDQLVSKRFDGAQNQVGPVVGGVDFDAFGEPGFQFVQAVFDPLDHLKGVFAVANHHDAGHGFALPVHFDHAAAQFRADLNVSDLGQKNGRVGFPVDAQGDVFQIVDGLKGALASHHELGFSHLDQPAAHVGVGSLDRPVHLIQPDAKGAQFFRIDLDLVLLDVAARRGHLGHAGQAHQLIAQEPVLDRTKLLQVVAVGCQGIHVDPAHAGGVRSELRGHAGGETTGHAA